ncbi:hypothetical protein [Desulfovibrio sp. 6_1_46AFAA]|uniref:hypothetical protein n=1 Tax=Desulfovibrio sp. 6_1_46AFAA TaxID=665942 RepID=UPI0002F30A46|nr:hypothetical protein [Desulfovibrio sp. 6_1_46AFAA]
MAAVFFGQKSGQVVNGPDAVPASRAGALSGQAATIRPSGARQGSAASRAASRRARGSPPLLRTWQAREGAASFREAAPEAADTGGIWFKKAP